MSVGGRSLTAGATLLGVLVLASTAQAKSASAVPYPTGDVWAAAVRYLRVDRGFAIREKDEKAGYVLFDYAESGKHPGPLPPPGVFARHNAVDTPALLPDGTAAPGSVSRVLAARGTVKSAPEISEDIKALTGEDSSHQGAAHTEGLS